MSDSPAPGLDRLSLAEARQALVRCCGSSAWVAGMLARRPFATEADLFAAADEIWRALGRADVLEAFSHHPQIGGGGPSAGGDDTAQAWSAEEQIRVSQAGVHVATALAAANREYAARFGYIFVVCATGKTADEMLAGLRDRLGNDHETELGVAAAEQAKITRLRLEKLAR